MELTNFGIKLFKAPGQLRYDDFDLTRHDESRYQITFGLPRPGMIVALHAGTGVEAARLFKQMLITRRLTQ